MMKEWPSRREFIAAATAIIAFPVEAKESLPKNWADVISRLIPATSPNKNERYALTVLNQGKVSVVLYKEMGASEGEVSRQEYNRALEGRRFTEKCDAHSHPEGDSAPPSAQDIESFGTSARAAKLQNVVEYGAVVDNHGVWLYRLINSEEEKKELLANLKTMPGNGLERISYAAGVWERQFRALLLLSHTELAMTKEFLELQASYASRDIKLIYVSYADAKKDPCGKSTLDTR